MEFSYSTCLFANEATWDRYSPTDNSAANMVPSRQGPYAAVPRDSKSCRFGIHMARFASPEASSMRLGAHFNDVGSPVWPTHLATSCFVCRLHTAMLLSSQPAKTIHCRPSLTVCRSSHIAAATVVKQSTIFEKLCCQTSSLVDSSFTKICHSSAEEPVTLYASAQSGL